MGNGFIIAGALCLLVSIGVAWVKIPLQQQRRIYWYSVFIATPLWFLAAYPDVRMGLGLSAMMLAAMAGSAYAYTPYLRIRGRIYAFQPIDINAESPEKSAQLHRHEQIATAPKMWWIVAGFALAFDVALISSFLPGHTRFNLEDDRELILCLLGFGVAFSVGFGYGEAKFGYPIAQRQRLQFIIASVSSAGLFAVLYLTSYYLTTLAIERRRD